MAFVAQFLRHDRAPEFVRQRAEIETNIPIAEINALAKKHLAVDDMLMVVVGDAKTLRPQLKALGYKVLDYQI